LCESAPPPRAANRYRYRFPRSGLPPCGLNLRIPEAAIARQAAFSPRTAPSIVGVSANSSARQRQRNWRNHLVFFRRRVFLLLLPPRGTLREKRPNSSFSVRWAGTLKTLPRFLAAIGPPVVSEMTTTARQDSKRRDRKMAHAKPRMGSWNVNPQPLLEVTMV